MSLPEGRLNRLYKSCATEFPSFEKHKIQYIKELIEVSEGNLTLAASISSIGRATLYRLVERYQLTGLLNESRIK